MATGRLVGQDTTTTAKPIMRDRIAFLFIGTLGCLILGGFFALWVTEQRPDAPIILTPTPTAIPSPTPTIAVGTQRAILLTVVDSLDANSPRLEGCWVLTFTPGASQYYWVGFSTTSVVPASGQSLEYYFNKGPTPDDRADFIKSGIAQLTENVIQPDYTVTVDRAVLAELVTIVGGVSLDGQVMNGEDLLARYDSLTPVQQLQFQQAALEAFVQQAQARTWTTELIKLMHHRYQSVSPDADELSALAQQALPFTGAQFSFNLWDANTSP
jgi:hypothetical protein